LTFGQSKEIAGCTKISGHEQQGIEDLRLFPTFTWRFKNEIMQWVVLKDNAFI
jgi:hypothetical protein